MKITSMPAPRFFLLVFCCILLIGYFAFGFTPQKESANQILDPISVTPEWMQVLVEEVLPEGGLHGWIPTGNFENSSLIKLPRFSRRYTHQELNRSKNLTTFIATPSKSLLHLATSAVKNERLSGQLAFASRRAISNLKINIAALTSSNGSSIPKENIQVRFVGYVPVERGASEFIWSAKHEDVMGHGSSGLLTPNIIADPLYELAEVDVPAHRTQPVWISIDIPDNIPSGHYTGNWTATNDSDERIDLKINITVQETTLPPHSEYEFFLDFWINPDAVAAFYELPLWSDAHWEMLQIFLKDYAELGGKTITTTITHEPWSIPWMNDTMRPQTYTGFGSMVKWEKSKNGEWKFDYSIFDQYVKLAADCGIQERINAYSLTAFRGKERIHYYDEATGKMNDRNFDTVNDKDFQKAWGTFLTDFAQHLKSKNWLNKTYLSFDERPNETMNQISKFIKEVAPEFSQRITIAGHPESTHFATGALSISYEFFPNQNLASEETLPTIAERRQSGKLTTFYLCGQPSHPNTLSVSPAIEARMIPWLALKHQTNGYLRWAYNSWPKDPFRYPVFNFIQGDDYIIYPGDGKPMSSIRRELLLDGIEDYELFRLVEKKESTNPHLAKALELATQNQDGRKKAIEDITKARRLLTEQQ